MDRKHLCLGAGDLDKPPKTSRSLGGRPLGVSLQRLGVDSRALAIKDPESGSFGYESSDIEIDDGRLVTRDALSGHQPKTFAKTNGATIVASDSMTKRGVSTFSFPHVIFSLGTAPE